MSTMSGSRLFLPGVPWSGPDVIFNDSYRQGDSYTRKICKHCKTLFMVPVSALHMPFFHRCIFLVFSCQCYRNMTVKADFHAVISEKKCFRPLFTAGPAAHCRAIRPSTAFCEDHRYYQASFRFDKAHSTALYRPIYDVKAGHCGRGFCFSSFSAWLIPTCTS